MPATDEEVILAIGCGLPRTGTTSLQEALEELLAGRCYHMYSFLNEGTHSDLNIWKKALADEAKAVDWQHFFKERGFNACVDFPAAYFYKELCRAFPKAKVILTRREPGSWHDSVVESTMRTVKVLSTFPANVVLALDRSTTKKMQIAGQFSNRPPAGFKHSMFSAIMAGKMESAKFYWQWEEDVRKSVPKERLLEFDVKRGWQPLCEFLGCPKPEKPFPRANDRQKMARDVNRVRAIGWAIVIGGPIVLAVILYKVLSLLL